jgi:hypothetical protein
MLSQSLTRHLRNHAKSSSFVITKTLSHESTFSEANLRGLSRKTVENCRIQLSFASLWLLVMKEAALAWQYN